MGLHSSKGAIQNAMMCFRLTFLLLTVVVSGTSSVAESGYEIGVILPLSGKAAGVGTSVYNGMTIALEGLPKSSREQLRLNFEDDESDPKGAIAALRHLISSKHICLVISAVGNSGHAIVPLTERQGLPLISMSYDRTISNNTEKAFTFFVSADALARKAYSNASQLHYRTVALITTQHEGNIAMRDAVIQAFGDSITFPIDEEVPLSDNEFLAVITKLRTAKRVDAIAALMHPAHVGTFAKELRRAGILTPMFTLGGFEDRTVRNSAEGTLQGQWYVAAAYRPGFLREYVSRYPQASPYGAAYGHDVILLLAQAAEKNVLPQDLDVFLRHASLDGGALIGAQSDGRNAFNIPAEVKIVGQDY